MIIFIAYVLIVVGFAKLIWPDQISYNPDMSEETAFACLSAIAVLFTLTNWTLAYFRFKEAEIINRM